MDRALASLETGTPTYQEMVPLLKQWFPELHNVGFLASSLSVACTIQP